MHRTRNFWRRVTEGIALSQLWSQFRQEARTSYGLYSREFKRDELEGLRRGRRFGRLVKQLFWAVMMKLSPARRVVLLIGLVLLLWPSAVIITSGNRVVVYGQGGPAFWGGLLLLGLLVLEIADRVTMKRDLEIAREIQQWLVPKQVPAIPGLDVAFVSRPANTVAGDYYDVLRLCDGPASPVLLVVADVAGKSLPAALLMATFQASLHTLASTKTSLRELVHDINRYACAHSQGGRRFTTAFFAELEPSTGCFTYTNAGHNPPLLRRVSGPVERLDVGGLPLGIRNDYSYESCSEDLAIGDVLLISTDGVVEAVNQVGEEYGEARLIAVLYRCTELSAQDTIQSLMRDLDSFVGDTSQHDDITCMIVRRVIAE